MREISGQLERSVPAVQHMRRKLKRLRELGTPESELVELLQVNVDTVLQVHLAGIRARAAEPLVPVKRFLRRSPWNRMPHLVGPYKRNRQTA
jgi:hypothetical protein